MSLDFASLIFAASLLHGNNANIELYMRCFESCNFQFSFLNNIEKHQRDNNKQIRNKNGFGWIRLQTTKIGKLCSSFKHGL